MIVGSVYLGRKAQKAYRKRQAEKAAQKLTAPYDIADPSDEIQHHVPPSSPTGSNVSTTPLSAAPSDSLSKLGSRTSTSDLSHSNSARSQGKSVEAQEYNHYVQRHTGAEEPPSYDVVMHTSPTSRPQSDFHSTSRPPSESSSTSQSRSQSQPGSQSSALSPSPGYPSSAFSNRFQRNCSTCITMMETFQTIYPHPHDASSIQTRSPHLGAVPEQRSSYTSPAIAEMPDPSVYQQRQVPQSTGLIMEAPDTGTYQPRPGMFANNSGPVPIELPAEMPGEDLSELMRADTVHSKAESESVDSKEVKSNSEILDHRGKA